MGSQIKKLIRVFSSVALASLVIGVLTISLGPVPPLGDLINPNGGLWAISQNADLPEFQTIELPGLIDTVTIYRDSYGVPHIYANTEEDLYFATGYVHAQDRLWQLDITRRQFNGRLSEILGDVALETDIFYRTIGLERVANQSYQTFLAQDPDSTYLRALHAYTKGINTYIENMQPKDLPLEFRLINYEPTPWRPHDTLAFANMMEWSLAGDIDLELIMAQLVHRFGREKAEELFPIENTIGQIPVIPNYGSYPSSPLTPAVYYSQIETSMQEKIPRGLINSITRILDRLKRIRSIKVGDIPINEFRASFLGSNNWVIDGTKSATGWPILANDMHLSHSLPPIWYEIHQVSNDSGLNVYGFSFIGAPTVIAGHNEYCAWGYTNVGADVTDFYYYKLNPNNPDQYWSANKGDWESFTIVEEKIPVKDAEDYPLSIRYTEHGPIISEEVHRESQYATLLPEYTPVAMRWTGHDTPDPLMRAVYNFNHMHNLTEFIQAGIDWWVPAQNTVFADIYGNVAIRPVGHYPLRPPGYWGRVPHNGSAGENEWLGFIPYDEIPVSANPSQHYLASANQKTAGPEYPYFLGSFFANGYRARRINELLRTGGTGPHGTITFQDMQRFQTDNVDTAALAFKPHILSISPTNDPQVQAVLEYIAPWNGSMLKDLVAPTIWREWLDYFMHNTFDDEYKAANAIGLPLPQWTVLENFTLYNQSVDWFNDISTSNHVETIKDIILKSMKNTIKQLTEDFGSDMKKWLWGDYHKLHVDHLAGRDLFGPLSAPPFRYDGDANTLNAAGGSKKTFANVTYREVHSGPSERFVVDLGKLRENTLEKGTYPNVAESVIPGGQRGWALSYHYKDQLETLYVIYEYHPSLFYASASMFHDSNPSEIESTLLIKPLGE
ncbi:MAG: penicillin acylase family protein [Candidatus Heimdallarchaeota archaeon]